MSSAAFLHWQTVGLARLRELEDVHAQATGSTRGRRWGMTQLNRSLFLALVAQFQDFCRRLHDEAVEVHVAAATVEQRELIRTLLTEGRLLDRRNPTKAALGSDFGRLGFSLVQRLRATGPRTVPDLDSLEWLIGYRNAVGHGDEATMQAMEATGRIAATKSSYGRYRPKINRLAGTMDGVVAEGLAAVLGSSRPW